MNTAETGAGDPDRRASKAVGSDEVHHVEHGQGTPVLVLHGAGVDHREAEGCFEPVLGAHGGLRRVYPDLPGMGRTPAASVRSADDVLELLLAFADERLGEERILVVGHSVGAYYALGLAARRPDRVAGIALVCPLLPGVRDVPEHRPVVAAPELGDEEFRAYFVVQTPPMLERYERLVAPALALVDSAALERVGERWELSLPDVPAFLGPVLLVAGRQDSTVGSAAALDLLEQYPRASLAVLDGAGHALPHEQPDVLAALLHDWLVRALTGSPAGGQPAPQRPDDQRPERARRAPRPPTSAAPAPSTSGACSRDQV